MGVLDTTERDPLMLNLKLRPMLDFFMEDMDTDLDTLVLDMPDTVMDLAMLLLTDTDTTARDPLMPSQRLRPMLDFSMEDMDWSWTRIRRSWICWIRLWTRLLRSWIRIRSWILRQEIR